MHFMSIYQAMRTRAAILKASLVGRNGACRRHLETTKGALKGKYQGQTIVESEGMHEVAAGGTLTLPHRPAIAVRAP